MLVACAYRNNIKEERNYVYQVGVSCVNNDDCIIDSENTKDKPTKAIWLTFNSKEDANTFIGLMDQLKSGK
jgi:hypothetical protein